jgi:hypothetical protein
MDLWRLATAYRVSWTAAGERLALTIRQDQKDAQAFKMPIEVLVKTASGEKRQTVWNDRSEQTIEIALENNGAKQVIERVAIDPDDWILKYVIYGGSP